MEEKKDLGKILTFGKGGKAGKSEASSKEEKSQKGNGEYVQAPTPNKLSPQMTLEVKNEEAKALIAAFNNNKTNETLTALINYMVNRRVLVPAGMDENKRVLPMTLTDPNGKIVQPVMTDKSFIPEKPKAPGIINLGFMEMVDIVLKEPKLDALGINVFTEGVILTKPLLQQIHDNEAAKAARQQEALKAAEKSGFTPINVPGAQNVELIKNEDGTVTQRFQLSAEDYIHFERVRFETELFPTMIIKKGQELIDGLCDRRAEYLDQLFEESYTNKRMYPYLPEEFKVVPMHVSDDQEILNITMPEQHLKNGVAQSIFVIWNTQEKTFRYVAFVMGEKKKRNAMEIPIYDGKYGKPIMIGEAPAEGTELAWVVDYCQQ